MDVGREDGGLHLSAGRGRQDGAVPDALCHHQPPVAAAPGDHPLHQPAEGEGPQGGGRGVRGRAQLHLHLRGKSREHLMDFINHIWEIQELFRIIDDNGYSISESKYIQKVNNVVVFLVITVWSRFSPLSCLHV